jgi:hypothetical protein
MMLKHFRICSPNGGIDPHFVQSDSAYTQP